MKTDNNTKKYKAERAIIMASHLLADAEDYDEEIKPMLKAALDYVRESGGDIPDYSTAKQFIMKDNIL
tara:strand:+ start:3330 stop:3533 length:204 start_codon:yes stop_codon:yes gene_type:complete